LRENARKVKMGRSNILNKAIRAYLLADSAASIDEIVEKTGASKRTVQYIRAELRKSGLLEPSRRESIPLEVTNIEETIVNLPNPDFISPEMLSDDEIRNKLLRQVQMTAFDPKVSAQTRLDAAQVWVKLRDISREKELGPGNPLTEEDVVDRLIRIMKACGPGPVIKALERAFKMKGSTNVEIKSSETVEGTSEDIYSEGLDTN
jgi:DNA-binding Lrp family transcriptional regulator